MHVSWEQEAVSPLSCDIRINLIPWLSGKELSPFTFMLLCLKMFSKVHQCLSPDQWENGSSACNGRAGCRFGFRASKSFGVSISASLEGSLRKDEKEPQWLLLQTVV